MALTGISAVEAWIAEHAQKHKEQEECYNKIVEMRESYNTCVGQIAPIDKSINDEVRNIKTLEDRAKLVAQMTNTEYKETKAIMAAKENKSILERKKTEVVREEARLNKVLQETLKDTNTKYKLWQSFSGAYTAESLNRAVGDLLNYLKIFYSHSAHLAHTGKNLLKKLNNRQKYVDYALKNNVTCDHDDIDDLVLKCNTHYQQNVITTYDCHEVIDAM
jgi:hypothetical protein